MSGNLGEARLLLIAIATGVDRKFDANLTSFVGILFGEILELNLLHWKLLVLLKIKVLSELKWVFTDILFLDRIFYDIMMFVLFDNAM